jgi:CRP/FNR family transcriptional regulator, cyclic AMP receptor protein
MAHPLWSNISSWFNRRTPLIQVLSELPLFSRLSVKELHEVEKIVHLRTYRAAETIFSAGDSGVAMYVILAGEVRIILISRDGTEQEIAVFAAGDLFGEMGLLDSSPRSATALAGTTTEVAAIARPDWIDLIHRHPAIGVGMLLPLAQMVATRLRVANQAQQEGSS